jgi:hypothetical protein
MTSPAPLTVPHITAPGWLAVAGRMADLAFETDRNGFFTACAPGDALGRPEGSLLGTRLAALAAAAPAVAASQFATIFETICADSVAWQGVLELIGADCAPAWHLLSLAPRYAHEPAGGGIAGTYGLIFAIAAPPPPAPSPPNCGTSSGRPICSAGSMKPPSPCGATGWTT